MKPPKIMTRDRFEKELGRIVIRIWLSGYHAARGRKIKHPEMFYKTILKTISKYEKETENQL